MPLVGEVKVLDDKGFKHVLNGEEYAYDGCDSPASDCHSDKVFRGSSPSSPSSLFLVPRSLGIPR